MKFKLNIIIVIILILTLTINVNSEVIDKKEIKELIDESIVFEKNQNTCYNIEFNELEQKQGSKFLFKLIIENYIKIKDGVKFNIYSNNNLEKTIENQEIKKENYIYFNNSQKQNNQINICVDNNYLPKIKISNKSYIGTFLLPEIKLENFYQDFPKKENTKKLFPINIYVTNTGYETANVKIYNSTDKFLERSYLENVSGETSFEGKLHPNQTKIMTYYIKTTKDIDYLSPIGVLEYENEVGEQFKLKTNQSYVEIENQYKTLDYYIQINKTIIKDQEISGKLILQNLSEENIEDILIEPIFDGTIKIDKTEISKLNKKDVIEIPFIIKTKDTGKYNLKFNIYYQDNNENKEIKSNSITIKSDNPDKTKEAIISILISLTIIFYIWVVKF